MKEEWKGCKRVFEEKGMCTYADWLRYYNNLYVAPGLEALEKMRAFYTEKGIDILKDAVSISGVSLHYLLRGAVERSFCWRVQPRVHAVSRSLCHQYKVTSNSATKTLQTYPWLRRQRALPVNHASTNALWQGKNLQIQRRPSLLAGAGINRKSGKWLMVRICRSGHQDTKRSLAKV